MICTKCFGILPMEKCPYMSLWRIFANISFWQKLKYTYHKILFHHPFWIKCILRVNVSFYNEEHGRHFVLNAQTRRLLHFLRIYENNSDIEKIYLRRLFILFSIQWSWFIIKEKLRCRWVLNVLSLYSSFWLFMRIPPSTFVHWENF